MRQMQEKKIESRVQPKLEGFLRERYHRLRERRRRKGNARGRQSDPAEDERGDDAALQKRREFNPLGSNVGLAPHALQLFPFPGRYS